MNETDRNCTQSYGNTCELSQTEFCVGDNQELLKSFKCILKVCDLKVEQNIQPLSLFCVLHKDSLKS